MQKIKHGIVNLDNMTIKMQFDINDTCQLIKIPSFNYSYTERESLGGGWYGSDKERFHAVQNNAYLVVYKEKPLGYIVAAENGRAYIMGKNSNKFIKRFCENYITNIKQNDK